jgi:Fe-Mn family superoxide dismutase
MATPFKLAPLPYEESALEPAISARTIGFHYHKHHKGYVDTLNKLVAGTDYADMKLEEIVRATFHSQDRKEKQIFNDAAQVWNHDFYWRSLSAKPVKPAGRIAKAIERDFSGLDKLLEQLAEAGKTQFGSGWAWLVSSNGRLAVEKTPDAENPMAENVNCILGIDVWEHAYYLDYQNERPKYLKEVLGKHLNWAFAAENLELEDHVVRAAAE